MKFVCFFFILYLFCCDVFLEYSKQGQNLGILKNILKVINYIQDRYRIKKEYVDFIKRRFCMDVFDDSMLCRKCCYMCEIKLIRDFICNSFELNKIQKILLKQSMKSFFLVILFILSIFISYVNCVICKKLGLKFVVVFENICVNVFI